MKINITDIGLRHLNLAMGMLAWFVMLMYSSVLPIGYINCGLFVAGFNIWAYSKAEDRYLERQKIERKVANNETY